MKRIKQTVHRKTFCKRGHDLRITGRSYIRKTDGYTQRQCIVCEKLTAYFREYGKNDRRTNESPSP